MRSIFILLLITLCTYCIVAATSSSGSARRFSKRGHSLPIPPKNKSETGSDTEILPRNPESLVAYNKPRPRGQTAPKTPNTLTKRARLPSLVVRYSMPEYSKASAPVVQKVTDSKPRKRRERAIPYLIEETEDFSESSVFSPALKRIIEETEDFSESSEFSLALKRIRSLRPRLAMTFSQSPSLSALDSSIDIVRYISFVDYIVAGDVENMAIMLESGIDPKLKISIPENNTWTTFLHFAVAFCQKNLTAILSLFCGYDMDLNTLDSLGRTPIFCTVIQNFTVRKLEEILAFGADHSVVDFQGMDLLMASVFVKNMGAFKYLTSHYEFDPIVPDQKENSLIHYALGTDDLDFVKEVFSMKNFSLAKVYIERICQILARLSNNALIDLFVCQMNGVRKEVLIKRVICLRWRLHFDFSYSIVSQQHHQEMHIDVSKKHVEDFLICERELSLTKLPSFTYCLDEEQQKLILRGAHVEKTTKFLDFIVNGDYIGMSLMLRDKFDISETVYVGQQNTVINFLHFAAILCKANFFWVFLTLINGGLDINSATDFGSTALHFATAFRNRGAVSMLIHLGANVGAQDNEGLSAATIAARFGFDEILELILECPAFRSNLGGIGGSTL